MKYLILILWSYSGLAHAAGAVGEMPSPGRPETAPPLTCTPDVNEWGNSSACECPETYSYDPRQGLCVVKVPGKLMGIVPRNGNCADAKRKYVLDIFTYQGGTAPYPGTTYYRAELRAYGSVIAKVVRVFDGGGSENEAEENWPYDVDLEERTKRRISYSGNEQIGREKYTVQMRIQDSATGQEIDRLRVLCHSQWNHIAP